MIDVCTLFPFYKYVCMYSSKIAVKRILRMFKKLTPGVNLIKIAFSLYEYLSCFLINIYCTFFFFYENTAKDICKIKKKLCLLTDNHQIFAVYLRLHVIGCNVMLYHLAGLCFELLMRFFYYIHSYTHTSSILWTQ